MTTRRRMLELLMAAEAAGIAAAQEHAHRQQARTPPRRGAFQSLTAVQATEVEALAALLIPSGDGSPGAREAGVVYFIDRALATFDRGKRAAYTEGLRVLGERRLQMFPGSASLASLPAADQLAFAHAVENTPFFEMVRVHTIIGFFGRPEYGGNRNQAGWKLIGFQE